MGNGCATSHNRIIRVEQSHSWRQEVRLRQRFDEALSEAKQMQLRQHQLVVRRIEGRMAELTSANVHGPAASKTQEECQTHLAQRTLAHQALLSQPSWHAIQMGLTRETLGCDLRGMSYADAFAVFQDLVRLNTAESDFRLLAFVRAPRRILLYRKTSHGRHQLPRWFSEKYA